MCSGNKLLRDDYCDCQLCRVLYATIFNSHYVTTIYYAFVDFLAILSSNLNNGIVCLFLNSNLVRMKAYKYKLRFHIKFHYLLDESGNFIV